MEETDPLDSIIQTGDYKGNQSIQLFIISLIMIVLAVLVFVVARTVGLPDRSILAVSPILCIISLALSIGGLNAGISERKYNKKWVKTGIIGNLILIILPVLSVLYLFYVAYTEIRMMD